MGACVILIVFVFNFILLKLSVHYRLKAKRDRKPCLREGKLAENPGERDNRREYARKGAHIQLEQGSNEQSLKASWR